MVELFRTPDPDLVDSQVIAEVHAIRRDLAAYLRAPRRWTGGLRRTSAARAIQGSNTIEGYTVSTEDAGAAVQDEPPLSADQATWAEILGYRRVLTYVLNVATAPGFVIDESVIRSMHFMLLEHDLAKWPGRYRESAVYVHDDRSGATVYEGPQHEDVPALVGELSRWLTMPSRDDPLIRAAMAHLNLVMIHPFRDGNGRLARALQTAVLAQDHLVEPTFSSIEEWLGNNTREYYDVLAMVGQGTWRPVTDTTPWLKFNLRAHHMQAQTLRRRFAEAEEQWDRIDAIIRDSNLPDRIGVALFDALLGLRVTRPSYLKHINVDERTATRDLVGATDLGLLESHGERRGRYYLAGRPLVEIRAELRSRRQPLTDPYPELRRQRRH